MAARQRALIDWDWEADGIWRVGGYGGTAGWRGWPTVLSPRLLADLKSWNDDAVQVHGVAEAQGPLRETGRDLARRVQNELGANWDVLYSRGGA